MCVSTKINAFIVYLSKVQYGQLFELLFLFTETQEEAANNENTEGKGECQDYPEEVKLTLLIRKHD